MGIPERRERERQELRKKILAAARELFLKRGYEAVTMREIAKRIEYSPTALYGHFADKDSLVRELCRQDFTTFAQHMLAEVATSNDPVERFARAGIAYLRFAAQYPEHYRLMFMSDVPPVGPEDGERDDPARNAYVFVLGLARDLLERGLLRPEITDADLAAQSVWAAVHGAAALDLIVSRSEGWLDFRSRQARFAATLEMTARSVVRDPEAAAKTLRRVLGEAADPFAVGESVERSAEGGRRADGALEKADD